MNRNLLRLFALAPLVASLSLAAAARQAGPPVPSNLILEIVYFEGAPTSFQLVPHGPEMVGGWFGRFKTVPRPAGVKDWPPVQAVNVISRVAGEGVEIKVSVYTGERMFDREEPVGTYTAGVGEEVMARGLERFGVEPFRMKVLRLSMNPAAPPVIVNKTQSIEATVSAFDSSKGVSARLSLRNLSSKRVTALGFSETRDGRVVWTRFAAEEDARPLIEPGAVFHAGVSQVRRGHVSPEGFYIPYAPETILIQTAVFEDGTYEGEPQAAARAAAHDEGARLQLARALALLRKAAAKPDAARLAEQFAALGYEADAATVESLVKRYPGLAAPERELVKGAVEVSMHRIRKELLDELAALEKDSAGAPDAGKLRGWLAAKRDKFEGWLSRLRPAKE